MPPEVAASSGLDILSHAIESFTAMPFTGRPRPDRPALRPAYQGSNPISDVWSLQALRMVAAYLLRAVEDPVGRRGAGADAAGGVLRRRRLRQRGRAPAARHVLSGVRQRQELSCARLRRRPSAGAARHLGHPERAGRVPLHGAGQPRAPPAGRRGARGRRVAGHVLPTPARSSRTASPGSCSELNVPNGLRAHRLHDGGHSRAGRRARCRSIA